MNNAELVIVGEGAERRNLESLATQLNIDVRFLGFLPQDKVAEQMRQADVFVLPSVYECGGAVVLEAMASGLAVIAAKWGGPCDYLDDATGVLVVPDERFVQNLSAALRQLGGDATLREAFGRAARIRMAERFDWERKIDRILELYRECLSPKS